jgi:two-component system sensor histidine kinase KdpD
VLADATMTRRLLRLLVAHARLRAAGTAVRVSASHLGARVELRVTDHGRALAAGEREQLFEGFRRSGDVPSDEDPGLGLALASALAEAQGASLDAEDTPGGGLTTVLSLPRV